MTTEKDAHGTFKFPHRSLGGACLIGTLFLLACSDGADETANNQNTGTGGALGTGGAVGTGGGSGGDVGTGGALGTGGETASGGALGSGGVIEGSGGDIGATGGDTGTGGDPMVDLTTYAGDLDGLFIDRKCTPDVMLPQATGATCNHRDGIQHVEEPVTFGGEAGTTYSLTLRVRGIWEPTDIDGGDQPDQNVPFMIGGDVKGGSGSSSDAINYQQFYIEVSSPAQIYWLNEHNYVAHEIHKEDYEITIPVDGGATVTVVANDGNEREIANFREEIFNDLPPYDQEPTVGQFLHLDVLGVEVAP